MQRDLIRWASRLWVILVLLGLGWLLARDPASLLAALSRLEPATCFGAFALLLAGKFLTILLVAQLLASAGEDRGFRFAWKAYSLADVAKYLPGGIWAAAGRVGIYRAAGIPLARGAKLLFWETLVLVYFSGATGLTILLLTGRSPPASLLICLAAAVVSYALVALLVPATPAAMAATVIQQICAWLCFGGSFALIAAGEAGIVELAGAFNIAFAAGTLAIFAPSGVGIRELVVGWMSGGDGGAEFRALVELAVVHRLVWLLADLAMLLPVLFFGASLPEARK